MAGPVTGYNCKLYVSALAATPTWTEVKGVSDVSLDNWTREEIELVFRGCAYKVKLGGAMEAPEVTFKFFHGVDNSMESQLQGYLTGGTAFLLGVADGDSSTAGTQIFSMPVLLTQMNMSQNLAEVESFDCKAVLTYAENSGTQVLPAWTTVTA